MSSDEKQGPKQVPLASLPPEKLNEIRQQLGKEVEIISQSYQALKNAVSRYGQSMEALGEFKEENKDKAIFVPLTSSMYVRGSLSNISSVLVDVGTNYFVEKKVPDAERYFRERIELLHKQLDDAAAGLMEKRKQLDIVSETLQRQLQIQQMVQRAQAERQKQVISA